MKLSDLVVQINRAKIGNAWERKFVEFKRCVGMPKKGTPLGIYLAKGSVGQWTW